MKLHEKALALAKTYQQTEAELLAVLIAMEKARAFVQLGFTGIFDYVRNALALSEAQAMYFQKVVRASIEAPTLAKAVTSGEISLSQARRIVPVVSEKNAETWIDAAKHLTQRELESAVASVNPKAAKIERLKPVSAEQVDLRATISPRLAEKLRRIQDLESQRKKRAVSLEEAMEAMADHYLERKDPVKKAERVTPKRFPQEGRRALPAAVKHAVVRRDRNRCQHPGCGSRRWVEIHHKVPLSEGGTNWLGNLTTLCGAHHRLEHALLAEKENAGSLPRAGASSSSLDLSNKLR